MNYCRYESQHKPEVIDAWQSVFRHAHDFLEDSFFVHEKVNFGALFLPKAKGICLLDQKKLVGYLGYIDADIGMMFIGEGYQGQGLGKSLLVEGLNQMRADGLPVAYLDVFEKNEVARTLYESMGFVLEERFLHEPTREWLLHLKLQL